MKTLEHQLADYGEHQRELHGPISPEELVTRLGRTEDGAFVGSLAHRAPRRNLDPVGGGRSLWPQPQQCWFWWVARRCSCE